MSRASTPNKKRTQQERSDATRKKIAITTFDLLGESGYANLRTAAVAKAAGVSQGGLVHHFETKDILVLAAVEFDTQRAEKRTNANLERFRKGSNVLESVIEDSEEYYFGESFNVALDVMEWGSQDVDLLDAIKRRIWTYRKETESAWTDKLVEQGWSRADAEDAVEMTVCMVRGFAIRRKVTTKTKKRIRRQLNLWLKIAHNLEQAKK